MRCFKRRFGPVDPIYKAINRITGLSPILKEYKISAITSGQDAQGEVAISLEIEKLQVPGKGVSTDIVEASAKAYIDALNRYLIRKDTIKTKYKGA